MNEVFADTSGWANYIISELVALFISPLRIPRPQQIQTIETIVAAEWIEVVHIDRILHDQTWQFLKKYDDKMWSLVDCSSFVVMQERRISQGFTTDHHFE